MTSEQPVAVRQPIGLQANRAGLVFDSLQWASSLSRLRAVILLDDLSAAMSLITATNRSAIDLPIDSGRSLLSHVIDQATTLRQFVPSRSLPVRLLTSPLGARLLFGATSQHPDLSVEAHSFDGRGSGGVLADAAREYGDNDLLLVLEAGLMTEEPLAKVTPELAANDADLSLFSHADHSPSGMMLVGCGCLGAIPRIGRVDMKTQGLPLIAPAHRVEVVNRTQPVGRMIQTFAGYISALQHHHRHRSGVERVAGKSPEPWNPVFSIVERGSEVASGVNLYDSVVLRGGRVETGATVVRSVVGPGGIARRGETCIDSILSAARWT